jgi:hypothetical protein
MGEILSVGNMNQSLAGCVNLAMPLQLYRPILPRHNGLNRKQIKRPRLVDEKNARSAISRFAACFAFNPNLHFGRIVLQQKSKPGSLRLTQAERHEFHVEG